MIQNEIKPTIKKNINRSSSLVIQLQQYASRCEYVGKKHYRYLNLKLFRNQIESKKAEEIYKRHSFRFALYRAIFYAFALLFVALAAFALSHTIAVTTTFFGSFEVLPKLAVCTLSLLLAVTSFAIGTSLCVAQESINQITNPTKKLILKIWGSQNDSSETSNATSWERESELKQLYKSTLYAIEEKKEDSLFLLREILRSKDLSAKEKQTLFCQTLDEMEDELNSIIENVKYRAFVAF